MKVIGVNDRDVVRVAVSVGLGVEAKDDARGTGGRHVALRPLDDRYAVVVEFDDDSEVRVVCQHGHEAFLGALFDAHPNARVVTPIADYRGLDGYQEIQPGVREKYLEKYGADPCSCIHAEGRVA